MKYTKKIIVMAFLGFMCLNCPVFASKSWGKFKEKAGDLWESAKSLPGEIAQSAKKEYRLFKKKGFKQYSREIIADTKKQAELKWELFKRQLPPELLSAPKKVAAIWLRITSAPAVFEQISKAPREKNIQEFLKFVKAGDIDNALKYLAGAQLNLFDKSSTGQSIFETVLDEYNQTPVTNKDKRALLVFALYKMHERSVEVARLEMDEDEQIEKFEVVDEAMQDLDKIYTAEMVWKKFKA